MKLKHSNCQNCGANDYKPLSRYEIECTYCGTVYELEKEKPVIIENHYPVFGMTACIGSTVAMTYSDNVYNARLYK